MIRLTTKEFKEMVLKAEKGAGKNSLEPITEMIGIKVINKTMYLCTTDRINYLQMIIKNVDSEDMSITVMVETLSKLISKVTSDTTELEILNDKLKIIANGTYEIPIVVDENGVIDFPTITLETDAKQVNEINKTTISNMVSYNKYSADTQYNTPFLRGYMIYSDTITTTNSNVICFNNAKFGNIDTKILLNPEMVNLLNLNKLDKINMIKEDNKIYFFNDHMTIYGNELNGVNDYPIDEIMNLKGFNYPSNCKAVKGQLLGALDRLQVLTSSNESNIICLSFSSDKVILSTQSGNSLEELSTKEVNEHKDFNCLVNLQLLKDTLNSNPAEEVTLYYGAEQSISFGSNNIEQVVALQEE